jgi:periplasmic divalent cation tolerance protein
VREGPAPDEVRVVLVAAPDAETAARIARALVEERLIACANLVPGIRSIYRWEGQIADEAEVLLVLKTCARQCAAVAARVKALHPYGLPEVVALPVAGGSQAYLDWVIGASCPQRAEGERSPSGGK